MSKEPRSVSQDLGQIQELVDQLARDVDRSVAVDNTAFELVCASAQIGVIDERRIAAIISRTPPLEPVPWMLGFGISQAVDPVRLPANAELKMRARVCCPIRRDGELLGYLWLFDEPEVSDEQLKSVGLTVAVLATLLGGEEERLRARVRAVGEHAKDILGGKRGALGRAHEAGHLSGDHVLTIQVVRLADQPTKPARGEELPAEARLQLELHRGRQPRRFLSADRPRRVTIVERPNDEADSLRTAKEVMHAARNADVAVEAIGLASAEEGIDQALSRARFAAELSALIGHGRDPLRWDRIGSWKLVAGWELNASTVRAISEDAGRLLDAGTATQRMTLLSYLDHARNTTITARVLFIHRATLHYRLERVRELLGDAALDDGWRSTSLHVALRLHAALNRGLREGGP